MSTCQIVAFRSNLPDDVGEMRNAWGGHAFVWNAMYDHFLKDPHKEYDCWLNGSRGDDAPLWKLAKREDIPMFMRAVHISTFDRALVMQANFDQFVADLRQFIAAFPKGESICHLPHYIEFIEQHKDAQAIGFYGTSVAEDPWTVYEPSEHEDEEGEYRQYDLSRDEDHFDVYARLLSATGLSEGE